MGDGTTGYGSVPYAYNIGTYEVTNAQYTEFLNAKAKSDPLDLWNLDIASSITRTGSSGSYSYSTIAGRENWPVTSETFYDALRFANWMNNGQGNGDTEAGAYTLLSPYQGGTPSNGDTVTRNAGASIVLTNENEWYKAAYYDPSSASYFAYPASSSSQPTCTTPTTVPNSANCYAYPNNSNQLLTSVGSYTGSASPYGTFDQGGNASEWNESIIGVGCDRNGKNCFEIDRGIRGGSFALDIGFHSVDRTHHVTSGYVDIGFRLAMIPEPSTGLLVIAGLVGLGGWRRARA
jgi:formylglycine-generating enzyme required for sulfatase activity